MKVSKFLFFSSATLFLVIIFFLIILGTVAKSNLKFTIQEKFPTFAKFGSVSIVIEDSSEKIDVVVNPLVSALNNQKVESILRSDGIDKVVLRLVDEKQLHQNYVDIGLEKYIVDKSFSSYQENSNLNILVNVDPVAYKILGRTNFDAGNDIRDYLYSSILLNHYRKIRKIDNPVDNENDPFGEALNEYKSIKGTLTTSDVFFVKMYIEGQE